MLTLKVGEKQLQKLEEEVYQASVEGQVSMMSAQNTVVLSPTQQEGKDRAGNGN